MKCPKCDYISFDYNQLCPKCRKDVSGEAERLNLPAFKPNPPALLGALTGETDETHVGLQATAVGEVDSPCIVLIGLADSITTSYHRGIIARAKGGSQPPGRYAGRWYGAHWFFVAPMLWLKSAEASWISGRSSKPTGSF